MRATIQFRSYNARRYSRPWIATVKSWPVGSRPELSFGGYLGDDGGGMCEVEANPGQIIRWGQKDNRGGNTDNNWGVLRGTGEVETIDQNEAREIFDVPTSIDNPLANYSDAELLAELNRRNLR